MVGLITDDDETAYREEVSNLAVRCQDNNLSVNVIKTKQMIVVTYSPSGDEKIWHGSSDPQNVLQLHHREHLDWLHPCLVWQLLGL